MTPGLDPIVPISYTTGGVNGVVTTTDIYQYLLCPGSSSVDLQISDANVLIGFGIGALYVGSGVYAPRDEVFIPTTSGLDRVCDIIRFKSATLGVPAQIVITARP